MQERTRPCREEELKSDHTILLQVVQPRRPAGLRSGPLMANVSHQILNKGESSGGETAEIPMAFLLLWGWQSSGYSQTFSPCTEHTHFSPREETEGKKGVRTFSRVLAKSFGCTCSRFPRMGRGAGPGGIFPFPDRIFHLAKLSRQITQTRRTADAAPRSSIFQVEESL